MAPRQRTITPPSSLQGIATDNNATTSSSSTTSKTTDGSSSSSSSNSGVIVNNGTSTTSCHHHHQTNNESQPLIVMDNNNNNNNNKTSTKEEMTITTTTTSKSLYVDEEQRDIHDYFNLVALMFVIIAATLDWNYNLLFQGAGSKAYTGGYFWWTWGLFVGYLLVDCVWVTMIPECVKIPRTLVKHHLVVIIYMLAPVIWPEYRWLMGALLSVELNTWFLIARRFVYKKKIIYLTYPAAICFYGSWLTIRCGFYPMILIYFIQLAYTTIIKTGKFWHWPMLFIPFHFALCCLNAKWTWDLFYPMAKAWIAQDGKKPIILNNGL